MVETVFDTIGITGGFIPSYIAGVIGGLAALPLWDFLKRVKPKGQ